MRQENERMQKWLKGQGIEAKAKYLFKGSMKNTWRLYNPEIPWTKELWEKLNGLGFTDAFYKPLGQFSGNGGMFSTFVRGHYELLGGKEWE